MSQQVSDAKRQAKGLAKWNKAKTVLRVSFSPDEEPFFALTQKAVQDFVARFNLDSSDYSVESVDRETLPDGVGYDGDNIYGYADGTFTQKEDEDAQ